MLVMFILLILTAVVDHDKDVKSSQQVLYDLHIHSDQYMFKEVRIFKENSYFEADQQLNLARWPSDLIPCSIYQRLKSKFQIHWFLCVCVGSIWCHVLPARFKQREFFPCFVVIGSLRLDFNLGELYTQQAAESPGIHCGGYYQLSNTSQLNFAL